MKLYVSNETNKRFYGLRIVINFKDGYFQLFWSAYEKRTNFKWFT